MTNHEIVKKLIGDIRPVGESNTDSERLENLNNMCVLITHLVMDIADMAHMNKNHYQHSIKVAVKKANDFMKDLKEI